MTVVLLTADLMVISRVDGAARQAGRSLRATGDPPQAVAYCAAGSAALLILDLSLPSLNVAQLVADVRSASGGTPRIIAFGPHVHAERLAAARNAGCDEVMSRGEFFARLGAIVA